MIVLLPYAPGRDAEQDRDNQRLSREILRLALGWHVHRPVQKHWGRP